MEFVLCHIYHGAKIPWLSVASSIVGAVKPIAHLGCMSGSKVLIGTHGYIRETLGQGNSRPSRCAVIKVLGHLWCWRAPCHISHWLSTGRGRSPARCLEQSPQIVGLRLDNLQGFNGSQICLPSECTLQSHLAIVLPSNTIIELELAFWSMTSVVKLIYSISTTTLSLIELLCACLCVCAPMNYRERWVVCLYCTPELYRGIHTFKSFVLIFSSKSH